MAQRSFHTCAGSLPRQLPADGLASLHVLGCAVWHAPPLGALVAELVLAAEEQLPPQLPFFFRQSAAAAARLTLHLDGGWRCAPPTAGLHSLLVRCAMPHRTPPPPHLSLRAARAARAALFPLLRRDAAAEGGLMGCSGTRVYGRPAERVPLHAASLRAWASVGCKAMFAFAAEERSCAALRALGKPLVCEVHGSLARGRAYYAQPSRHALCLVYARASAAAFLALTDTDEFPSPLLPPLLRHAAARPELAGLRLFFDPDGACPPRYCPEDEADWRARCAGGRGKRNHWKPIVIPNRTSDVDVHQFTPIPPHVRKQVWKVCIYHRLAERGSMVRYDKQMGDPVSHRIDFSSLLV
ncbi:hypothetical protein AB1Y20_014021 [Prymnesium parvum]|uniref:Glycosyltransferase family 92 protein n=1 Tax=Prymnesium parvum TaxID=97485 RepID=A0AB34IHE2_PRYPA